ncbi:hypothetical protein GLGCALEP_03844 [Pseudomonas sp. MM221]|nr:hypothetical protein DBADOPDK_03758 [Pseudomonas sp. MM223]CAI3805833.1 hypothetical protein GLGCALEP_03844 [Pseudomonas sp. MM221]
MALFDRISIAMADGFSELPSLNALGVFGVMARHLNFCVATQALGVMILSDQGVRC